MQHGVAHLGGCPDGSDGTLYPNDAQLEQLFVWLDTYAPFEVPGDGTYLTFAGAGSTPADATVQQEITDWLRSPPWAPASAVE